MRYLILFIFCVCNLKVSVNAQSSLSVQAGIGRSIISNRSSPLHNLHGGGTSRGLFEIRKLVTIDSLFEVGAAVSFEQYNFSAVSRTRSNPRAGIDLDCSGNYIFLKPVVGIGLGPKKIFHFFIIPSIGVLTSDNEITRWLDESKLNDKFTYAHTDGMNRFLFRVGVEAEQQFPLMDNWRLLLNEGYQFAISKVTSSKTLIAIPRAGLMSIRVGVCYTFNKPTSTFPKQKKIENN